VTLETATELMDQVVRSSLGWHLRHLACKAFNAHQFSESASRPSPSQARMDGAAAELRLVARMARGRKS
jgi:hypothetical protein